MSKHPYLFVPNYGESCNHFGYYDRPSLKSDFDYLLSCRYLDESSSRCDIHVYKGVFAGFNNSSALVEYSIPSSAHNYQQGCLATWLHPCALKGHRSPAIIYNTLKNATLCSEICLLLSDGQTRFIEIPHPIQSVSPDGKYISIDYNRLKQKRREYSYSVSFSQNFDYHNSALAIFDLNDFDYFDSVSLDDLMYAQNNFGYDGPDFLRLDSSLYNFNHCLYSPSGEGFVFLARVYSSSAHRTSYLFYKGKNDRLSLVCVGIVSHFCFISESRLFVWGMPQVDGFDSPGFFVIDLDACKYSQFPQLMGLPDGHPTYSDVLDTVVFDTYPDFFGFSSLYSFNFVTLELNCFYSQRRLPRLDHERRIDFHPRFSTDGTKISFDTVDACGRPSQCVLNLDQCI